MSWQAFGQVVGAIAGFYLGPAGYGAVAAAFGSAIGGAVGSSFDSLPTQYGPRLDDLTPQSSDYGRPIPIVYGTVGIQGNVIWSSDYVEEKTETDVGGKGGPSQTAVSYSYYGNFAIAFAEGECSIGRMWAGPEKRLIYDGVLLEGGGTVRFYSGSEDQLPDPLIESYLGAGNVPAYRGTCYVVFEKFPLVKDGNVIPFITAEVGAKAGARGLDPVPLGEVPPTNPFGTVVASVDPTTGLIWTMQSTYGNSQMTYQVTVTSDKDQSQVSSTAVAPSAYNLSPIRYKCGIEGAPLNTVAMTCIFPVEGGMMCLGESGGSNRDVWVLFGPGLPHPMVSYTWDYEICPMGGLDTPVDKDHGTSTPMLGFQDPVSLRLVVLRQNGYVDLVDMYNGERPFKSDTYNGVPGVYLIGGASLGPLYFDKVLVTQKYFCTFLHGNATLMIVRALGTHEFIFQTDTNMTVGVDGDAVYDKDRDRVFIAYGVGTPVLHYKVIDLKTLEVTDGTFGPGTSDVAGRDPSYNVRAVTYYQGKYIVGANGGLGSDVYTTLYMVDANTLTLQGTFTYEPTTAGQLKYPLLTPSDGKSPWVYSFDSSGVKRLSLGGAFQAQPVGLGEIVADLSARAGLTADQIDVSALTDMVDGYAIAKQTSVRSAIDALRPTYYFDAVESEGVVKFVKRGGESVADIDLGELDAHQSDGEPGDPLPITRQMEVELPRTVNVNYLSEALDYSGMTKIARRLIGSSDQQTTLDFALVMSDTKAQEVAEVNVHLPWVQRLKYGPFKLPRRYGYLEPTDPITIDGYGMLLTKVTASPTGVLTCEAVAEDASHYTPHVVVTETPPTDKVVYAPGETTLELM
jgi:hypothetical protein